MTRRIPTIKKYFYALIFSDKWKDHWTMGVQWPYSVLFVTGGDNIAIFFSPHVLFASYFYLCLAIMVPGVSLYRWLDVRFKYRFKNVEETKECILSHQISRTYLIEVHQIKQQHGMCTCPYIHTYILSDMGFHNMTMRCWKFDLNMSLPTQFFEHLSVIFTGPTKWELCV